MDSTDSPDHQPSIPAEADSPRRAALWAMRFVRRTTGMTVLVVGLAYLAFFRLALALPYGDMWLVVATTLLSIPLLLLFCVTVARACQSPAALAVNLCLSLALVLPLEMPHIVAYLWHSEIAWAWTVAVLRIYTVPFRWLPGLDGLILIWLASSVGALLARMMREFKMLLPVALALAAVDLYVVFGGGLVTQARNGSRVAGEAMRALTVRLPTIHPQRGAAPMQLAIGFADFLFVALFFACFRRFSVPSRSTFIVLALVLAAYMGAVATTGTALPALVPVAVVVIAMHYRRFVFERSESFALLYAGLVVAAVLSASVYLAHR